MISLKLNDLYTHKHAKGNRESSMLEIWYSLKINCQVADGQYAAARKWVLRQQREQSASRPELAGQNKSHQVRLHPTLRCPPRQRHGPQGAARREANPTLAPGLFTCCAGSIIQRGAYKCSGGPTGASSMCWVTSEVWFLSKNAVNRRPLTSQNTENTQIRHLGSCLIRMIRGYFTHGADFFLLPLLPSLIGLRIPDGPSKKEFLPLSLSVTVEGSPHGNNPEKRARKTSKKKSNMVSESGL